MVDPVRLRAWEILVAVQGGADLDPLLETAQDSFAAVRDRAFLAVLVRGTLQWQGRYDYILGIFASRKPPRDPGLLCLLRLSLYQLLNLDGVPPFAAIDQAVRLCKKCVGHKWSGFVNGLLRSVQRKVATAGQEKTRDGRQDRVRALFTALEPRPGEYLAAWHSHPRWLVDSWITAYGEKCAADLCAFNNEPVALDLHVLGGVVPSSLAADLKEAGCPVDALAVPGGLRTLKAPGRKVIREILSKHPELIVQDGTVQAATRWLGDALVQAPSGLPLLDMCAAPGGKAVSLAARMAGARPLVAMDLDAQRMRILNSTVSRTAPGGIQLVCGDGMRPPLADGSCGGVLLDGPCSGTGVLRRHPDARWRLRPSVVRNKARFLLALAGTAVDLLAPGGVLMYATCSVQPEENQDVVQHLLERRRDLEPCPDDEGCWRRTWLPPLAPGDGFFAARLRRKS